MNIELPDKFVSQLKPTDLMLDLACGMYSAGHLTLGQAAELAGCSQAAFQKELGHRGIAANYDMDELLRDVQAVAELTRK
ncbi:MAG: hypothetical protein JWO95_2284 [Verrucomicrobiales bacterium]|nr:hypothetical protein [Verrucomicrobiales bacterium]